MIFFCQLKPSAKIPPVTSLGFEGHNFKWHKDFGGENSDIEVLKRDYKSCNKNVTKNKSISNQIINAKTFFQKKI